MSRSKRMLREDYESLKEPYIAFYIKFQCQLKAFTSACETINLDISDRKQEVLKSTASQFHKKLLKESPNVFQQKKEEKKLDDTLKLLNKKIEVAEVAQEAKEKGEILEELNAFHNVNLKEKIEGLDFSSKKGYIKANEHIFSYCLNLSRQTVDDVFKFKYLELASKIAGGDIHKNITDINEVLNKIKDIGNIKDLKNDSTEE